MNVTEKVDQKMRSSSFHVSFLVMVLKLPKNLNFLQFCADLSKKPIKAIYLDISKRSSFAL